MSNNNFSPIDGDEALRCAESWYNGNLTFAKEWITAEDNNGFTNLVVQHLADLLGSKAEAWASYDKMFDDGADTFDTLDKDTVSYKILGEVVPNVTSIDVHYTLIHESDDPFQSAEIDTVIDRHGPIGRLLGDAGETIIRISKSGGDSLVTEMWKKL